MVDCLIQEACPANPAEGTNHVVHRSKLTVGGRELHFGSLGQGQPVLLMHTPHRYGVALYRALSVRAEHQIILVDIPGFYRQMEGQPVTHIREFVDLLASLQDQLGCPRVHLLGKCAGALAAWEYAAQYPGRVARVVAVAPPLSLYSTLYGAVVRQAFGLANAHRTMRRLILAVLNNPFCAKLVRRATVDGDYARLVSEELARCSACFDEQVFFGVLSSLAAIDIAPLLKKVLNDTLIVFGANDPSVGAGAVDKAIHSMPSAGSVCIADANHGLLNCQAARVNQAVVPFLLAPRAPSTVC
jgi:pimeloyl-ACP methyl ester carboxylesterase